MRGPFLPADAVPIDQVLVEAGDGRLHHFALPDGKFRFAFQE